jgi:hypothetical protein
LLGFRRTASRWKIIFLLPRLRGEEEEYNEGTTRDPFRVMQAA